MTLGANSFTMPSLLQYVILRTSGDRCGLLLFLARSVGCCGGLH